MGPDADPGGDASLPDASGFALRWGILRRTWHPELPARPLRPDLVGRAVGFSKSTCPGARSALSWQRRVAEFGEHLVRWAGTGPHARDETADERPPKHRSVLRAARGPRPPAHRGRGVKTPLERAERPSAGQRPNLVTHLVEEPLARVVVRRAEGAGLVHHDARRTQQPDIVAKQPRGEFEVVVPQEEVGVRQPRPADRGTVDQYRNIPARQDVPARGSTIPASL